MTKVPNICTGTDIAIRVYNGSFVSKIGFHILDIFFIIRRHNLLLKYYAVGSLQRKSYNFLTIMIPFEFVQRPGNATPPQSRLKFITYGEYPTFVEVQ